MFRVATREFFYDIKSFFGGKKILIPILYFVFILFFVSSKVDYLLRVQFINLFLYGNMFMQPQNRKILFILPIDHQNRANYYVIKGFCSLLLILFIFIFAHILVVVFGNEDCMQSIITLICQDIPFIMCTFINIDGFYNQNSKKEKLYGIGGKTGYVLTIVAVIIPFIHIIGLSRYLPNMWYVIVTILSYICAFHVIHYFIPIIKQRNASYEYRKINERKSFI